MRRVAVAQKVEPSLVGNLRINAGVVRYTFTKKCDLHHSLGWVLKVVKNKIKRRSL